MDFNGLVVEALKDNERESKLRQTVYQNIDENKDTYQELLGNNTSLNVDGDNGDEFTRNLGVLEKLGGNTEGVFTPTHMGRPHQWLLLFGVIGFFVSLPLLFAGIAMIELLYVGIVLFVLSIVAMIIYSQKFGSEDAKHFCVMDLRIQPKHFYKVFYSGSNVSPTLVKIWKYKYDDSFALNHQKEEGEFVFNEQGYIVPGEPHDPSEDPFAHSVNARSNDSPDEPHDPSEDPFAHSVKMAQENNSKNHVPFGDPHDIPEDPDAQRIYDGYEPNESESDPRFTYAMDLAVKNYRGIQEIKYKKVMTYERAFLEFMKEHRKTYIKLYPHFYTYLDNLNK